MLVYPCCKINLGLNIVARRPDGYHNLETVFYPIPLCDTLEVRTLHNEQVPFLLHGTGIAIEGKPENNLVVRAYLSLKKDFPNLPPVEIGLHKRIPSGAGLGGGSSDAAFMMRLLCEKYQLPLSKEDIKIRLASLGADCPFFYDAQPALGTGTGTRLTPFSLDLQGWYLLLVKAPIHVSTAQAYAQVRPQMPTTDLRKSLTLPVTAWRKEVKNDFEPSVFAQYPRIEAIKTQLYDMGATYAAMSGSGASVFGLFAHEIEIPKNDFEDCFVYHCRLPAL